MTSRSFWTRHSKEILNTRIMYLNEYLNYLILLAKFNITVNYQCIYWFNAYLPLATDYKWKTDVVSVKLMSTSAHTLCILQQSDMYFTTIGLLNKSMCLINVYLCPYSMYFTTIGIIKQADVHFFASLYWRKTEHILVTHLSNHMNSWSFHT